MLNRARDANRDVKLWRDDLAGLANLVIIRDKSGVDRCTTGAKGGTKLVGERLEQFMVVLAAAHAAATGNDNLGGAQFRTF